MSDQIPTARNLQYIQAFAEAWPDGELVQQSVAQLLWGHQLVAEYALADKSQPMGVAEFKLLGALPPELQSSLPSVEQIERELAESGPPEEETAG